MGFGCWSSWFMCFFCEAEIQHQLAMDHPNICRLLEAGWRDSRGWMIDRAGSLTTENFQVVFKRTRKPLKAFLVKFLFSRMWCREKKHTLMEIVWNLLDGGNSNIFSFHPETWGRWTQFDKHIFQMGWFNHQLEIVWNLVHFALKNAGLRLMAEVLPIATCAVPSSQVYEEPTRLLLVMEKLNGPDLFDAFSKKCLVFSECGEVTISTFLATDPKTTRFRKTTEMYDHFWGISPFVVRCLGW